MSGTDDCLYPDYCGIGTDCSECYQRTIKRQQAEVERLEAICEAARDFDSADEDAEFDAPHPIFMLAQHNDELQAEVNLLKAELKSLSDELAEAVTERGAWKQRAQQLEALLLAAPHDRRCPAVLGYDNGKQLAHEPSCNCWKADALRGES